MKLQNLQRKNKNNPSALQMGYFLDIEYRKYVIAKRSAQPPGDKFLFINSLSILWVSFMKESLCVFSTEDAAFDAYSAPS